MPVRIVRLGTPRKPGEGLRIGTVRRPPRGVPKARFASDDWYDVWLPDLAPSSALVQSAKSASNAGEWERFRHKYFAQMKRPEASRLLDLLAALSHTANFAVGCYCDDESRCHRSLLRKLLEDRGAAIAPDRPSR